MRKSHKIKSSTGRRRPTRMVFFDTEAHVSPWKGSTREHTLRLGWACYWERPHGKQPERVEWHYFTDASDFWGWVLARHHSRTTLYVVAHNLVYDFHLVRGFQILADRGYTVTSVYSEQATTILRFRCGDRRLVCLDNLNYFRVPLRLLGEEVGLQKMEVDPLHASEDVLRRYCKRDVEILLRTWQRYLSFLDQHDAGSFGLTISSQAWHCWTHRFLRHDIYVDEEGPDVGLARQAYCGGRCEAYWIGEVPASPVYYLDVNSMYPYVMAECTYPVRRRHYWSMGTTADRLNQLMDKYLVCARVLAETEVPCVPCKYNGKLIFPVGEFETTLCTPELLLLITEGRIKHVYEVVLYEHAPIFRDYVEYWYWLKCQYEREGREAMRYFSKGMLNHLYGKFGQRSHGWKYLGEAQDDDGWYVLHGYDDAVGTNVSYWNLGGKLYQAAPQGESYNSYPAIAAHVTAYARAYLWHLSCVAGREHVYYCDTDALFVDQEGYDRLQPYIDPHRLGALSLRGVSDRMVIHGAKWYEFGGHVKCKGRKPDDPEIEPDVYQVEHWPGLSVTLSFPPGVYRTVRRRKRYSRDYDKGVVEDGRVLPIRLPPPPPQPSLFPR